MAERVDVAVIGSGVLGAFHAHFALRHGYSTLLIERDESPRMATVRNFGMVVPSGMKAGRWHEYGRRSAEVYRQLATEANLPVQFGGTQYVAETPLQDQVAREFVELAPAHGYRCEYLDAAASLRLNPCLQPDYVRSSVYFPDDLRFDPRTLPRVLLAHLRKDPRLTHRPATTATRVEAHPGHCTITTHDGTRYEAAHVFVCSGADLRTLYPESLRELRYCKLQMMRTEPQRFRLNASLGTGLTIRRYPAFSLAPGWQALQQEGAGNELDRLGIHILVVQDPDGRLVLGDSHEYSDSPLDESLDARTTGCIMREVQRILRLDTATLQSEWSGVYTVHPEQDLLRKTLEGRIHLVTGIGGKGMTTSPGVAEASILSLSSAP